MFSQDGNAQEEDTDFDTYGKLSAQYKFALRGNRKKNTPNGGFPPIIVETRVPTARPERKPKMQKIQSISMMNVLDVKSSEKF